MKGKISAERKVFAEGRVADKVFAGKIFDEARFSLCMTKCSNDLARVASE